MNLYNRLVVQVAPYYPPHLGGAENVARTLAEELSRKLPVEVLTTAVGSNHAPRVTSQGLLRVVRCRAVDVAHTPISPGIFFRLMRLPASALVHVHIAQAVVPELVWLSAALRRRPFVAHFHLDVEPSGVFGWGFQLYKNHLLARTLRAAARVIVLTPEQRRFVHDRYQVPAERIVVVPNGVGGEFFDIEPDPADDTGRSLRLLYVGRFNPQKNLPLLVSALARTRSDIEVVLVGDGELRPQIERQINDAGLANVSLVGAQYGADLVRWYRWADAFVLPSVREGAPLVLLEAMAAGLAVIATDVDGSRETLAGAGLLTPLDPTGMAAALDQVASDPALRATLQSKSRAVAADRTWEGIVGRLTALYAEVSR